MMNAWTFGSEPCWSNFKWIMHTSSKKNLKIRNHREIISNDKTKVISVILVKKIVTKVLVFASSQIINLFSVPYLIFLNNLNKQLSTIGP